MTVPTISGVVKPLLDEDFPVEALELEFGEETGPVANEDIAGARLGLFRGWDYLENCAQAEWKNVSRLQDMSFDLIRQLEDEQKQKSIE